MDNIDIPNGPDQDANLSDSELIGQTLSLALAHARVLTDMRKANQQEVPAELKAKRGAAVKALWAKNPWYRSWQEAKQRCTNPNNISYPFYGARGITFNLTKEDMAFIWKRDNAAAMQRPSIDRINADGHYTLDNCRFLEFRENARQGAYSKNKRRRDRMMSERDAVAVTPATDNA